MVVGSSPVAATLSSYIKPGLCKEFLDIQATSESRFTLNIFFFFGGGVAVVQRSAITTVIMHS